MNLKLLDP